MRNLVYIILIFLLFSSCEDNEFELCECADEFFFLRNDGADMPVWVRGNTLSKTFIVVLHGGPGAGAVGTYHAVKAFEILEEDYAVVYWDQRGAGATQGHYNMNTINPEQIVEDLEKLIVLIKSKYGNDISLFMHGTSWGGYLGFAYLIKGNNQENIKGWIDEGGAHNVSLTANATRRKLIEYGNKCIQKGVNIDDWQEIVNWCEEVDTITTSEQFADVNTHAHDATELIKDSIAPENIDQAEALYQSFFGPFSYRQFKENYNTTDESSLIENFIDLNLSPELHKVTIPVLLIGGKFDLIVPNDLLYDAYDKVSSVHKEVVIFNKSGHAPSASQAEEFAEEVDNFIATHK